MTEGSDSSSLEIRFQILTEEFRGRLRRGESATIEEYVERAPDLAEMIEKHFPIIEQLESIVTRAPTQLGAYRILRELGVGGMGVVYEAEQESLGRRVALKVLPFHARTDERLVERFGREARMAARLRHPNILPIYDVGQDGGIHYYTLQYVEGASLQQVLPEVKRLRSSDLDHGDERAGTGPGIDTSDPSQSIALGLVSGHFGREVPNGAPDPLAHDPRPRAAAVASQLDSGAFFRTVARMTADVADGLSHAHENDIVHRDIKPANLLLDLRGSVWLADFGLAKALEDDGLTRTGEAPGTLRYMSPEQLDGKADQRSDIYSLGVTLCEALTQEAPFGECSRETLTKRILTGELKSPREIEPAIPRNLETIVLKATVRDANRRYQTASEFAADLKRFVEGARVRARRPWRSGRRRLVIASAAIVLLAAAVLVAVWFLRRPAGLRFSLGGSPRTIAAVDVDGDGRLDLVTSDVSGEGGLSLLRGGAGGGFEGVVRIPTTGIPGNVVSADLDGDEVWDFGVCTQNPSSVRILLNEGDAILREASEIALDEKPYWLVAADVDGDTDVDLVTTGGDHAIWVLRNAGDGTFTATKHTSTVFRPTFCGTADLAGDSRTDVFITSRTGERYLAILENRGEEGFREVPVPEVPFTRRAVAVDLDGDGSADLAGIADGTEDVWIARRDADGHFEDPQTLPSGLMVRSIAAADLDGDEAADLIVVGGEHHLAVLCNAGTWGQYVTTTLRLRGSEPTAVLAVDLDSDEQLDMAVANEGSHDVTILYGRTYGFCAR